MIRLICGWTVLLGTSVALLVLDVLGKKLGVSVLSLATLCAYIFILCDARIAPASRRWQHVLARAVTGVLTVNIFLNMVNLYRFSLPGWFYLFKVYRFITLSPIPFLFFILVVVMNHWSHSIWTEARKAWWIGLVFFCLIPIFVSHTLITSAQTLREVVHTVQNLDQPFEDRLVFRLGGIGYNGWIWPYAQFILRHTPPTAKIGIPPQSDTWKMEGNVAYMRWFLYPRTLVNLSKTETIISDVEYLLIAQGDCALPDCFWPKINISQEKIRAIYGFDKATASEYALPLQSYQPKQIPWGLLWLQGET